LLHEAGSLPGALRVTAVGADVAGLGAAVILYRTVGFYAIRPLLCAAYRAEVTGREHIPRVGPCIVVANHESMVDPFVLGLATRRVIRYMAKAELWRNGLLSLVMEGFGTFPVERGRADSSAVSRARALLEQGEVVGVFPQGTCTPFRHRPFHRTAARLALETGAPLVPVALVGTERILRPHSFKVGLPKVRVVVAEPIRVEPQKPTTVSAKALTARIESEIAELRRPYGEPAHAWID
jgi:1-acyl-sn-glycerol-3-phosphate acyltransferase